MKIIETLSTFTGNLTQVIAEKVYALTNIDDISTITFISVFLISYFVFFITTKFAPVFSEIKASLVTSTILTIILSLNFKSNSISENILDINNYGFIIFIILFIFSILMIMQNSYYEGLFGRFRENN